MSNLNIFFMLVLFCPLILCQSEHRKDLLTCNNGASVKHQWWAQTSTGEGHSTCGTGISTLNYSNISSLRVCLKLIHSADINAFQEFPKETNSGIILVRFLLEKKTGWKENLPSLIGKDSFCDRYLKAENLKKTLLKNVALKSVLYQFFLSMQELTEELVFKSWI